MAVDFIPITVGSSAQTQAQQLKNLTIQFTQVYAQTLALRDTMTHLNDGVDFSKLETQFGVPAGTGQEVFDLLNGAAHAMEGTMQNNNIKTITEKLG
jgi:hypothetical protein